MSKSLLGHVWRVVFDEPLGAEAGFIRPALDLQADALNVSELYSVIVVPLTARV